jgi:hypothetical protein
MVGPKAGVGVVVPCHSVEVFLDEFECSFGLRVLGRYISLVAEQAQANVDQTLVWLWDVVAK